MNPSVFKSPFEDENLEEDFFDPGLFLEDLAENDLKPSRKDSVIDDRDLPKAPNFITWCLDKRFLSIGGESPFPRQIQVAAQLLGDACPDCSDPSLINNMFDQSIEDIQDRIKFLEFGVCPKCKQNRLDFYNAGKLNLYNELCACWGQRSGKTAFTGSMLATYHLHRFLCLDNPGKTFGLLKKTPLYMFFTAFTAQQARDTLWVWFKGALDDSPWFKSLHQLLDYQGQKTGEQYYQMGKTYYEYTHKNLRGQFVAPNKKALRGKTNFLTCIDEWGWFDHEAESNKVTINGEEINIALVRGLITVRSAHLKLFKQGQFDLPTALCCNVSSPSDINDNIMKTLRLAQQTTTILGSHYATWEVNVTLPKDSLQDEFRKSPIKAARDLGAQPPIANSPFIENYRVVEKVGIGKAICLTQLQDFTDTFGDRSVFSSLKNPLPDARVPRILAIDTGRSNNSFAILMGHMELRDRKVETKEKETYFVTDLAIEVQPKTIDGDDAPINFSKMLSECILALCGCYNVALVVYDRWQSLHQIDELKDNDINAQAYSLTWSDFCSVRAKFLDGLVELLKPEIPLTELRSTSNLEEALRKNPAFHLSVQLLTVREIKNSVQKPVNGTDDLFRCLWLAAAFIFDPEYLSMFSAQGTKGLVKSNQFLAQAFSLNGSTPAPNISSGKFVVKTLGIT